MAKQHKQVRSCGFLIVDQWPPTSFLLMEHANRWDLPKGHVDPGETDHECALRELVEETGIASDDIEIIDDFEFVLNYTVARKSGGKADKTLVIFLARLLNDVAIQPTEHIGYQWNDWNPPHKIQSKTIDPLLECVQEFLQPNSDR